MNLATFHFLRPEWLWALLLLLPLGWSVLRRARSGGAWERVCDAHLLRHLVATNSRGSTRFPFALLALGWTFACLALAGPAWERLPQQTFREPARTVFVLSLGDSMNLRDVRPTRLTRARHKLLDALDRSANGSVALVVVREEAFAVTPITDDARVLREAVPLLETKLMPGRRVQLARGIEEALRLLEPVGARGARIVLVTDDGDEDPDATEAAVSGAVAAGARVSVLGVLGESDALAALARSGNGAFAPLAVDDGDLDRVLAASDAIDAASGVALTKSDVHADEWKDMGAWLLWIPLALAPFAFRRGWATAWLALLLFQLAPARANAIEVEFFERPDQKGARAFAEGRFEESAQFFEDPAWQAAARYRAGDFAGAAEALAPQPDPRSQYNLGNALAKAGKLDDAVAAYERALATTPDDEDARFNRDLVKKLLEQQQQQQQQSKDDSSESQQNPSDASQEPADSDGKSGDPGDAKQQADAKDGDESKEPGEPSESGAGEAERHEDAASDPKQDESETGSDPSQQQAAENEPREGDGDPAAPRPEQGEPGEQPQDGEAPMTGTAPPSAEEQQRRQWMARLPDDPGGLLREKIRRDYLRKQSQRRQGERP